MDVGALSRAGAEEYISRAQQDEREWLAEEARQQAEARMAASPACGASGSTGGGRGRLLGGTPFAAPPIAAPLVRGRAVTGRGPPRLHATYI